MCDLPTDEDGVARRLYTDSGGEYVLTNPRTGLISQVTYRLMCGYTLEESNVDCSAATLYSLRNVILLRDSTLRERASDPTIVQSVWRSKTYLNLMLVPRTQGRRQYWGYCVDSLCMSYGVSHLYLSLYHNQNHDVPAYSSTEFASVQLDRLQQIAPGDSVTIKVHTYDGIKSWAFIY